MTKKRNRFWTVILALLPGAGHMFNGFMKRGVSLMTMFFTLSFFATWLNLGAVFFLAPVIWFYAFFDCINLRFQDDEGFYSQEDNYLFSLDVLNITFEHAKVKLIAGITLVVMGFYILWENVVLNILNRYLPEFALEIVYSAGRLFPQLIVATIIIVAGISLIKGKKSEVPEKAEKRLEEEGEAEHEES